jgi:hypothetical protein
MVSKGQDPSIERARQAGSRADAKERSDAKEKKKKKNDN